MRTFGDLSKAKRVLNYEPIVEFDEGLKRTVEHLKGALIKA